MGCMCDSVCVCTVHGHDNTEHIIICTYDYDNYYSDMVAMVDDNYNTWAWLHASKRAFI